MLQIHHSFKACLSGTFLFNIHSVLLEKKSCYFRAHWKLGSSSPDFRHFGRQHSVMMALKGPWYAMNVPFLILYYCNFSLICPVLLYICFRCELLGKRQLWIKSSGPFPLLNFPLQYAFLPSTLACLGVCLLKLFDLFPCNWLSSQVVQIFSLCNAHWISFSL